MRELLIAGVDEVGRGCLAGPVVSAAVIFKKKIELDDKFLFRVTQEIQNKSGQVIELYPYAQITRNENPDVTDFYILHEGFIGVFDEELKEDSYNDIEDRKKEKR